MLNFVKYLEIEIYLPNTLSVYLSNTATNLKCFFFKKNFNISVK